MSCVSAELLRLVCAGDLRGWQGLSDLSLAELTSAFPRDSDWSSTAQLGRRHREANYLWVLVPGSDQKLRIWLEMDRVILLDLACSGTLRTLPDHLAGLLAEVPTSLDAWLGTLPVPESELVFPRHGLAAFVNRETQSIWHLALFPPQTLDEYVDNLRIDMRVRRHQPRHPMSPSS
jgi:hypothetical protein